MNYLKISKETIGNLYKSYQSLQKSPLDPALICLIEILVSKINGCQYCIQTHTDEAHKLGIDEEKISQLEQSKTSNKFTAREKVALSWAQDLTLLQNDIQTYDKQLNNNFSEREIVDLTACISLMNALNRLALSLRK